MLSAAWDALSDAQRKPMGAESEEFLWLEGGSVSVRSPSGSGRRSPDVGIPQNPTPSCHLRPIPVWWASGTARVGHAARFGQSALAPTACRAPSRLPVVQSIAYLKNVPEATLIDGSDYEAARERQEAYYVMRELPGQPFSFPVIAAVFRKKDHAAVMHGCKKVEALVATDPDLRARLRKLTRRVGAAI